MPINCCWNIKVRRGIHNHDLAEDLDSHNICDIPHGIVVHNWCIKRLESGEFDKLSSKCTK